MSTVYRHLGGGDGAVEPPGDLAEECGDDWDIRCYRWVGSEYWVVRRRVALLDGFADHGLRCGFRGWSSADRVRAWLDAQADAWGRCKARRGFEENPLRCEGAGCEAGRRGCCGARSG